MLQNLHLTFDWHYIGQSKVEISQNFVAFSEYMNFKNKDGPSEMISSHYALVMTDLQAISYQKLSSPMNTTKA